MKILKRILIGIVTLISVVLIIALFVKQEYSVVQEITINKPKAEVFDYVKYVKNQDQFNKWVMMDPNAKKDYSGTDGTTGFVFAWNSENDHVGQGEQKIKNIRDGEMIESEIRFIRPFEGLAKANIATQSVNDTQTKVSWSFESKMPYPMNIMRVFINIEDMLGKDLKESLNNLKTVLENKQ
jgi:hypothetical protein